MCYTEYRVCEGVKIHVYINIHRCIVSYVGRRDILSIHTHKLIIQLYRYVVCYVFSAKNIRKNYKMVAAGEDYRTI